ncbi:ribonuclease catalytic domain-containing protein [Candidatus Thioglobus sp.]|nr:ribonuclease catalytic domain-containing protein [Candidatus Thioglobus sp.]MDA8981549.1 ribonuclease catalytic domain-containing protein [Candidatus Thioglobus sp.]
MSIIGALVAYKGKPAKVVAATTHKYEVSFSDGTSQKIREKDFRYIHPEYSNVTDQCSKADINILNDLQEESLSLQEITEWIFDDFTSQNAWCVYLMSEDGLYFYWSKGALMLRPIEQVKIIQTQRNEKALAGESLERCIVNLNNNIFDNDDIVWINEIEQVALNKSKHSKAMSALSIDNTPENAHELLVKLKFWSELTNPYPQRHKVYLDEEAKVESKELSRKDLTHLTCLAIDNSGSSDADDAISIDGDRLWIHIADVASYVEADSELDIFAQKRASNLYLPDQTLHMLPPEISSVCSLGGSEISNAISIGLRLDSTEITDIEIHLSEIKVTSMSYEHADKVIDEHEILSKLNNIAISHKAFRNDNGAIKLNLPSVDVKVKDEKVFVLPQADSISRELVAEMMVIAGRTIAQFAIENNISLPYLTQEAGNFSKDVIDNIQKLTIVKAFEASRGFKRSKITVKPSMHSGLGLSAYTRVTSPMRRYLDLLVQQQLVRFLSKLPTLDDNAVKDRIKVINSSMPKVNKASRQSIEHFKCLYLKQNNTWEGEGVVVEVNGEKALINIPSLAMMTQIKFKSNVTIEDRVKLKVGSINLFERLVNFKPL